MRFGATVAWAGAENGPQPQAPQCWEVHREESGIALGPLSGVRDQERQMSSCHPTISFELALSATLHITHSLLGYGVVSWQLLLWSLTHVLINFVFVPLGEKGVWIQLMGF